MKINKMLNILGKKVKIKTSKDINPRNAGEYRWKDETILINPLHENREDFMHTIIHEITHAMLARSGAIQGQLSYDMQEFICENVATVLTENFDLRFKNKKK